MKKASKVISWIFLGLACLSFLLVIVFAALLGEQIVLYLGGRAYAGLPEAVLVCGVALILHALFGIFTKADTVWHHILPVLVAIIFLGAVCFFSFGLAFALEGITPEFTMQSPDGNHTVVVAEEVVVVKIFVGFYEQKGIFLKRMAENYSTEWCPRDITSYQWTDDGLFFRSGVGTEYERTYTRTYR